MGKEIVYCSDCGNRITSEQFERGLAVTVLQKHFCGKCSGDAVKSSSQGAGDDPSKTPPPLKLAVRRVPAVDKPITGPKIALPYGVAIGIAVLAIALLLIVLFRK